MTLGEKIRWLREERRLTQGALGDLIHMTQRKISYLECEKCEPSLDDIVSLCQFFHVSADWLLDLPHGLTYFK